MPHTSWRYRASSMTPNRECIANSIFSAPSSGRRRRFFQPRLGILRCPAASIVVVESMNVITSTAKSPLVRVSLEYMDAVWPNSTVSGIPVNYAMVTDQTGIVGPVASSSGYVVEVVGTQRPTPLSSNNSSTYLTAYLPDVFMAASCVFGAAYLKNFGAMQDD